MYVPLRTPGEGGGWGTEVRGRGTEVRGRGIELEVRGWGCMAAERTLCGEGVGAQSEMIARALFRGMGGSTSMLLSFFVKHFYFQMPSLGVACFTYEADVV